METDRALLRDAPRVAVKPLLTSLDLFEQVSTYADQTPQAHPNVFHVG